MHSHPQLRMPHAVAQRSVAIGVVSVSVTLAVELNGTDLSARFQSREARRLTDVVYETGAAMHPVCSKSIATQPVRRGDAPALTAPCCARDRGQLPLPTSAGCVASP
jgi:hypothetical protein